MTGRGAKGALGLARVIICAAVLLVLAGCSGRMRNQPRFKPLAASSFFADGRSARPLLDDTVARAPYTEDEQLETGRIGGFASPSFPFPVTQEVLERGRERYDIFCAACHDRAGYGRGMAVRRGFKAPPSYHEDRLRSQAPGYFVDVIARGFGAMPSYGVQIPPRDRWAITAWIRVLQLSQNASVKVLSQADLEKLGGRR